MDTIVLIKIIANKFDVSSFLPYFVYMNITIDNLTIDHVDPTSIINEEYTMVIVDDAGKYWESCIVVDVQVKDVNTFNVVEILDNNDNEFAPSNLDEVKNKIQELVDAEVFAIHEGKYSSQGAW